jgi:hypothetical protein
MRVDPITGLNQAPALNAISKLPARPGVDPALASKFARLMQAEHEVAPTEEESPEEARGIPTYMFLGQMRA